MRDTCKAPIGILRRSGGGRSVCGAGRPESRRMKLVARGTLREAIIARSAYHRRRVAHSESSQADLSAFGESLDLCGPLLAWLHCTRSRVSGSELCRLKKQINFSPLHSMIEFGIRLFTRALISHRRRHSWTELNFFYLENLNISTSSCGDLWKLFPCMNHGP